METKTKILIGAGILSAALIVGGIVWYNSNKSAEEESKGDQSSDDTFKGATDTASDTSTSIKVTPISSKSSEKDFANSFSLGLLVISPPYFFFSTLSCRSYHSQRRTRFRPHHTAVSRYSLQQVASYAFSC